ncbi:hypothetical protein NDU88_005056 [Pleurodeles waltl]|uniref:Uncharacterized protein n=1 Tax=Pleurodeles waltl TaxID=8319 RepID=A0AAV7MWB9_PLEWA|nr:hypothetical protein NDU88_005056 [Pleurodeles waltl]
MPSYKAGAGKRKGRDPELSQLLKMVLEKLGNDDTDNSETASDNEVNGEANSRPSRSHVAPRAAFPPVKRRNRGKAPVSQSSTLVVSPQEQVLEPEVPVPSVSTQPMPLGAGVGAPVSTGLGVAEVLDNICKSLASLPPTSGPPTTPAPAASSMPLPADQVPTPQAQALDSTRQALLQVSKLLGNISAPASTPPPTTPWSSSGSLQNSLAELKPQVDALAASHSSIPPQAVPNSPSVTPTPSAVETATPLVTNALPNDNRVPGKDNSAKEGTTDALLSRPGKLAAHVSAEVKEKIWKGEFVDIFSLMRARRREVDNKDKEVKSTSSGDKKPKVNENITNWLFGFNVFMSVLLEKKPELGISLIYYANKILKSQHTYGVSAWLEYDRDFRWAKVEDPSIGWDQTEVNVWLQCVNNKVPGRQPFRS